ncbi:MAG: pyridoxal phosphate-dependent aminotransferase, partial [Nanoarchaeota archaeon]
NGYGRGEGDRDLRNAVASLLQTKYDLPYTASEILIMPGSRFAIAAAMYTLCNQGQNIIIPQPYWAGYTEIANILDVRWKSPSGLDVRAETIDSFLGNGSAGILLNSPNNPSGRIINPKEMKRIADSAHEWNIGIISDEAYRDYMRSTETYTPFASVSKKALEQTIEIFSFSKSLAVCGWRISALAVKDTRVYKSLKNICWGLLTCAALPLQRGVLAGLADLGEFTKEQAARYEERAHAFEDIIHKNTRVVAVSSQGGIFSYVDISSSGMKSQRFCEEFYMQHGVLAMPGIFFGDAQDNYIRISLIQPPQKMAEVGNRLLTMTAESL